MAVAPAHRSQIRTRRRGGISLSWAIVLMMLALVAVGFLLRGQGVGSRDGRTPIVVWGVTYLGEDVYTIASAFERENPQYRVVIASGAERDVSADGQRLISAVAGGVPPDIVFFARHAIGEWASRGALLDLNPLIDTQASSDPNRINPAEYYDWALDECRYTAPGSGGKAGLFGLPLTGDVRFLLANVKLLREAGYVDAKGDVVLPKNWDELRACANKLTVYRVPGDKKSGIERLGFAPNYGNAALYLYAWQAGGELLSRDGKTITMDAPGVVRALHYMTDVYDDLGGFAQVDAFQRSTQMGQLDPFLTDRVAMLIHNDWYLRWIAFFRPDMEFVVVPVPMPADRANEPPVTWAGGFSLVVPSTSKNPQGAFKFMQYLSSWNSTRLLEQGKRERNESEGRIYLPEGLANRAQFERLLKDYVNDNPRLPPTFRRAYQVIQDLLPHTKYRPVTPVGQLLWSQQVRAYEAGVGHQFVNQAHDAGVDEMRYTLQRMQLDAQRRLDEAFRPAPAHVVSWGWWFALYAALIGSVAAAMLIAFKRHRVAHSYRGGEVGAAMFFLSPWLILMIVFLAGPILFSIVISFTRYDVISPARYVGMGNYREIVADPLFYKSITNTAFMLIRVPLMMAVSLGLALLLNRSVRGIGVYRTIFYLPAIVPIVASAFLWMWLLEPTAGPINSALRSLFSAVGLQANAPLWLQDPAWSKSALIVMSLWTAGAGTIIWLAGLQSIPPQLYEAASIDGAGAWRRFLTITLPMLSPFILFNAIVGVIATMQMFVEAFIMTAGGPSNAPPGGPADSTTFYSLYLFKQAFQYFRMGYASAMAWVLFLIVLALTLFQMWIGRRWIQYERT
jgi:ABC-type sugar transport system permease subunit/ABC-type glycerol-3-phosphate transport system substrate-binding protein